MNQKIKEYWEKQGHTVLYTSVPEPTHYYHMNGNGPMVSVARLQDGFFVYWNYPHWVSEEEMLKII